VQKLAREFYNRDTVTVAQELLGKYLVQHAYGEMLIGRIVEVEAYLGVRDLACHSAKGLTPRTKVMFGPPGHAYVYLIYGMYHCMNVVTEPEGTPTAVLIRAVEPIKNISMRTQGPGLLCKAMQIDSRLNMCDLTADLLYLADEPEKQKISIIKKPRIGVDYAKHWTRRLLRFYIKDNLYISKK
jgi:DNA-3-methyladenine glycosylase